LSKINKMDTHFCCPLTSFSRKLKHYVVKNESKLEEEEEGEKEVICIDQRIVWRDECKSEK